MWVSKYFGIWIIGFGWCIERDKWHMDITINETTVMKFGSH